MSLLRGKIEFRSITSLALQKNPLGDPHERELVVYLPPSYAPGTELPWIMLLPPYGSSQRTILEHRLWERSFLDIAEDCMAAQKCEAVIVSPDAQNRWGGSQFVDSAATGAYQTFLADEVTRFMEANYGVVPANLGGAIGGRSSGGFGGLRMLTDRPGVFDTVFSHAGDAYFEASLVPHLYAFAIEVRAAGGLTAFIDRVSELGPRGDREFMALMMLSSIAAYTPDAAGAFPHVELPIDIESGQLIASVVTRLLAADPMRRIPTSPSQLAGLVYLDAGNRDEYALQYGAMSLAAALRERCGLVVHNEYPGSHRGTRDRIEASLMTLLGRWKTMGL